MLRQVNVKRQLTIPAPLAKRMGLSGKSWVDVSEKNGTLIVMPLDIEAQGAKSLALSDKDWDAFNRKVQAELRAGKGKVHETPQAFLTDLKRRIRA
jgi:bifunctional DNA-binding transcriptional regulator/antitoxin component of YhaV-PrlF toxin-antitoxin module